ncbi:penicillin acylase family protein [bacterium]|nr:penicillin acylase family protein [bacterium]
MPKWFKIITGIFLVFSLLFAGIIFIGYRIVAGSLPKISGIVNTSAPLHSKISVFRDGYGIPHIISRNRYDLFFAQGFATAQDRLWQMDIQRRTAYGRLSEIFGIKAVPTDSFMLSLNIGNTADKIYEKLSIESKEVLNAYKDGINSYISLHKKSLPIEFRFLNYSPDPWKASHSIALIKLFAWQSSRNFLEDAFSFALNGRNINNFKPFLHSPEYTINSREFFHPFLISISRIFKNALPIGSHSSLIISIPADLSDTNTPFIAFNYTSPAVIPGPWYEIHLASDEINVHGFSLPGVPLIFTGQNSKLSWVFSSTGKRDCRFSEIHTLQRRNSLSVRTEKIKIFPDSVLTLSFNEISGLPVLYKNPDNNRGIALIWDGYKFSDDILSLFNICKSRSLDTFTKYAANFGSPCHIFIAGNNSEGFKAVGSGLNKNESLNNYKIFSQSKILEKRLKKLIEHDSTLTLMEIKNIISDAVSPSADSIAKLIYPILNRDITLSNDPVKQNAANLLSKWNGSMLASNSEASIINTFLVIYTEKLMKSLFGKKLYKLYSNLNTIPYESILNYLYKNGNRDNLIISSFSSAIDSLKKLENTDVNKWPWGKFHTITFSHMLGKNPLLSNALNVGPFPISGSGSSILNSGSFIRNNPEADIYLCASAIYNVSNPDNSISVLSTGQSGQPVDEHYKDQVNLSVKNLFHPSLLDTAKVKNSGWKLLIIQRGNKHE